MDKSVLQSIVDTADQQRDVKEKSGAVTVEQFFGELGSDVLQFSARMLVMREMLQAQSAAMSDSQRLYVEGRFRRGVEGILAATDDRPMPGAFHDALLSEVRMYLRALETTGKKTR